MRVRTFTILIGVVAFGFVAGNIFHEKLGQLTLAFGVVGAGIAFAAQEVIVSVAGWLTILFARFYQVGDRVELGGIRGDVVEIGVLRTSLLEIGQWVHSDLYNGRTVLVANSFIFKQPVFNYSGAFPYLWDELELPVRYDSDTEAARRLIRMVASEVTHDDAAEAGKVWERLAKEHNFPDPKMAPMVTLVATDNWMQFTVRYVVNYRARRVTQDRIFTRILEEVEKSGGRVSLASSTSQIIQPSSIDVFLREPKDGAGQAPGLPSHDP